AFFFQAEDGIRDLIATGVQTCALPIYTLYECKDKGCGDEFIVFANETPHYTLRSLNGPNWKWVPAEPPSLRQYILDFLHRIGGRSEERRVGKECRCGLSRHA